MLISGWFWRWHGHAPFTSAAPRTYLDLIRDRRTGA
jgi:hypothetical protein